MRILFLSRWFPYPLANGAKTRIFHLLKGLAGQHGVDLIAFSEGDVTQAGLDVLRGFCQNVVTVPYKGFQPGSMNSALGFFSPTPRSVVDTYSREMAEAVQRAVSANAYDLVIASQIDMAIYARDLQGPKKIFEELEITKILWQYQNQQKLLSKARYGLTWLKLKWYVADLLKHFDGCTVVSQLEQAALLSASPNYSSVAIVPNGVDIDYFYFSDGRQVAGDTLIYTGAITYAPNFEAVEFFLRDIFPCVLERLPEARFVVTGKVDGVPLERLPLSEQVSFTGYLEDIRPTLSLANVNVVPLVTGGGTRLKILESLAMGVPVVSTSRGAEGLDVVDGQDVFIADRPDEFAAAVVNLMQHPSLRDELRSNGRRLIERHYNWDMIVDGFLEFTDRVVAAKPNA